MVSAAPLMFTCPPTRHHTLLYHCCQPAIATGGRPTLEVLHPIHFPIPYTTPLPDIPHPHNTQGLEDAGSPAEFLMPPYFLATIRFAMLLLEVRRHDRPAHFTIRPTAASSSLVSGRNRGLVCIARRCRGKPAPRRWLRALHNYCLFYSAVSKLREGVMPLENAQSMCLESMIVIHIGPMQAEVLS